MFDFYKQFVRLACIAICAVCLSTSPLKAVDDLFLNLEPGSDMVMPGDTVTVSLFVANLSSPINGVQALMNYDPSILSLVSITETNLGLLAPSEGWVRVHFSDNAGDIVYAVAINGSSIITTHAVATLTFTAISEGATSVSFNAGVDPFVNKITLATDNSTLFPTLTNTSLIISSCDDGLFCNGSETFDGLVCQPGTNPCNDGIPCTVDSCDDVLDICTNAPDDLICDNTLFCDGAEFCDALLGCQLGTDPCDDGITCTVDTCDDALDTCTQTPDDNLCSNGIFCDGAEICDAVQDCLFGFDPCGDGVTCTIDTCDDVLDTCTNTPDDAFCSNGIFCDGAETCDPALDCQLSSDPCSPLLCDEANSLCFAPIHITNIEAFYAGRYLDNPDPGLLVLTSGSTAALENTTNYIHGITGIRITFDNIVVFTATPDAAFSYEWTTGIGTTFAPVTDPATNISVFHDTGSGVSVIDIVLADDYARSRWLKVTIDSAQVLVDGVQLDGELLGNPVQLPSGEGSPGGNAIFYIGNMAGDVTGDLKASLTDAGQTRLQLNPALLVPITNVFDVDKDGKVQLTDAGLVRLAVNPAFTLPLITAP